MPDAEEKVLENLRFSICLKANFVKSQVKADRSASRKVKE
jgi:hypothetical protein